MPWVFLSFRFCIWPYLVVSQSLLSLSTSLFSLTCHFQGLRSPLKLIVYDDNTSQVEARYPAILFKQQLTACVEKIFGLIRDNLKKELSPLLGSCIQVAFLPPCWYFGDSSNVWLNWQVILCESLWFYSWFHYGLVVLKLFFWMLGSWSLMKVIN